MYSKEHGQFITPAIKEIIDRATAVSPDDRYQSAEDMRADILDIMYD